MKRQLFFMLLLQFVLLQQLTAQELVLKLDEDRVLPTSVIDYYPNYYQLGVTSGETQYVILKGTAVLMRNGEKIAATSIANKPFVYGLFDRQLLPGSQLLIEVQLIGNPETRQTTATKIRSSLHFKKELKARPHPKCMLYLNNTTDYYYAGISSQKLEEVRFDVKEEFNFEKVDIYHVRGTRPIRLNSYTELTAAKEGFVTMLKDSAVMAGDRIVLDFTGRGGCAINVAIVE